MEKLIAICAVTVLFGTGYAMAGTWTTLDYPGAVATVVHGINGNNIVGWYSDGSRNIPRNNIHGFVYDGTSWVTLDMPGLSNTQIFDIDGSNIVGFSSSSPNPHSFLYSITNQILIILNEPGAVYGYGTVVQGISDNTLVGYYEDSSLLHHGFSYNGTAWATLDYPGAYWTDIHGISGSNLVGWYMGISENHGFIYEMTSQMWTLLPIQPRDVDGSNVVGGDYLYNLTTQILTTLDYPGANQTQLYGIDGISIVGSYTDASGDTHGFLYTIPEPATLLLLGFGAVVVRRKRKVLSP